MFYVESKGNRWAMMAVPYKTREDALAAGALGTEEGTLVVYDCTESPVGTEIARFDAKGQRLS